jgi:hypothetical protein
VFTQAVQIRISGQPSPQSKILALEDQIGISGIKEHLVATQNAEGEGLSLIVKANGGLIVVVVTISRRARQNRSGNLVNFFLEIRDENVKTIVCVMSV